MDGTFWSHCPYTHYGRNCSESQITLLTVPYSFSRRSVVHRPSAEAIRAPLWPHTAPSRPYEAQNDAFCGTVMYCCMAPCARTRDVTHRDNFSAVSLRGIICFTKAVLRFQYKQFLFLLIIYSTFTRRKLFKKNFTLTKAGHGTNVIVRNCKICHSPQQNKFD